MKRKFMISGLIAAGFGHHDPLQAALTRATSGDEPDTKNLFQIFTQDHLYTLAGHASHSSHSSHASHGSGGGGHSSHYSHSSHTSHYSSTGGYPSPSYNPSPVYTSPTPTPTPSPAPAPSASRPSSSDTLDTLFGSPQPAPAAKPKPLPGRSALFKQVVMRVQIALMGRGLFEGPIDGDVGPRTRNALRHFQQSQGFQVTGTITSQTLDALHVPSQ